MYDRVPLRGSLTIGDTVPAAFSDEALEQPEVLPIPPPHFLLLAAQCIDSYAGLPHTYLCLIALTTRLRKLSCLVSKVTLCSDNCYTLHVLQIYCWLKESRF